MKELLHMPIRTTYFQNVLTVSMLVHTRHIIIQHIILNIRPNRSMCFYIFYNGSPLADGVASVWANSHPLQRWW